MEDRLRAVAKKVWPARETMSGPEQSVWSHNVTMLVYSVPLPWGVNALHPAELMLGTPLGGSGVAGNP